jgi:hypothetical protein
MKTPIAEQTMGNTKANNSLANLARFLTLIANNPAHPQKTLATKLVLDFSPQLGSKA